MIKWHLETRKISSLKNHSKNPRRLTEEQFKHLSTSLQKFGLIDKPIINPNGLIIGGHQRKNVLYKLGIKEVECWVPSSPLDDKQIDELNVRLNKNTGEWDFDILANEWDVKDLTEWGFTAEELAGAPITEIDPTEEDEDDGTLSPGTDEDAIAKLGDIFHLNEHRIICGDSTNGDIVCSLLEDSIPILMVTDPPYGVEYDPSWRDVAGKGCRAKGKVQNDDRINWALAWSLFPGSVAYVWHAGKFCSEVQKSLEQAEFEIISQIIWAKQHFALSRGDYHWQHEPCWYAVRKGHSHNWQGARDQSTTWEISNLNAFGKSNDKDDERTAHSTQKPIDCMLRPIKNNSQEGEGVYDPFLGSGTTLIACEQANRVCYGIELSPAYIDIIIKRWIKYMIKSNKDYSIKRNGEECLDYAS